MPRSVAVVKSLSNQNFVPLSLNWASRSQFDWVNMIALAYGIGWGVTFAFIGRWYLAELIAMFGLMLVGPIASIKRSTLLKLIISGYFVLFVGIFISDQVNSIPYERSLRGLANPVFAAFDVLFVSCLFMRNPKSVISMLVGISIGSLLLRLQLGWIDARVEENQFKANVVPIILPLILLLMIFIFYLNRLIMKYIVLLIGIALIFLGARSTGLSFCVAAVFIFMSDQRVRIPFPRVVMILLLSIAGGYGMYFIYIQLVLDGVLGGNSAWQVRLMANPYNPLELLVYGRTEVVVAASAVRDAPLWGHGSWATDTAEHYSRMFAAIRNITPEVYFRNHRYFSQELIKGHSVILTSWLWGGVLGLLGILMVVYGALRRCRDIIYLESLFPVAAVLLADFVWNAMFSPIGHIRTTFPVILGLIVCAHAAREAIGRPIATSNDVAPTRPISQT